MPSPSTLPREGASAGGPLRARHPPGEPLCSCPAGPAIPAAQWRTRLDDPVRSHHPRLSSSSKAKRSNKNRIKPEAGWYLMRAVFAARTQASQKTVSIKPFINQANLGQTLPQFKGEGRRMFYGRRMFVARMAYAVAIHKIS